MGLDPSGSPLSYLDSNGRLAQLFGFFTLTKSLKNGWERFTKICVELNFDKFWQIRQNFSWAEKENLWAYSKTADLEQGCHASPSQALLK